MSCSNCGNPICTDCMTSTTVGMRCPDCAGEKTQVRTLRSLTVEPRVTYAIMAVCVVAWLAEFAGGGIDSRAYLDGALVKGGSLGGEFVGVQEGEPWRLLTSGFLHDPRSPIHILFNMYILYWLGTMLEPALGHLRFAALYLASLLAGSLGALLVEPNSFTVGASGAVFGLMGAAFVMQRAQGVDPMQSGIGPVILINLALSFIIPNISIGGHLGGLVGGAAAALGMDAVRRKLPAVGVCAAIGAVAVAASLAI